MTFLLARRMLHLDVRFDNQKSNKKGDCIMPNLFSREVDQYWVDAFAGSFTSESRAIRFRLKPSGGVPHTVRLDFVSSPPADFMNLTSNTFSYITMGMDRFDIIYHLLQTEKPLFFTAYKLTNTVPPTQFAGLSSDAEGTGEGFKDPNAP
jgi:hypothetical protein